MPTYLPGSFTKNFGWAQKPPGLRALHQAIRSGFSGAIGPVPRDIFRSKSGISDTNRQLIPLNFFLHNTIRNSENFASIDELILQAVSLAHSRRFDFLALFAMHLGRLGKRVGVAGDPKGAGFTNEFVRTVLWNNGGWERARLTETTVEAVFKSTVKATGSDTVHKCVTNYLFMFERCGLRSQRTPIINTRIDEWIGPGLFLAFDRYWLDEHETGTPSEDNLLAMVGSAELHKLMGTSQSDMASAAPIFAREYLAVGGLQRLGNSMGSSTVGTISNARGTPRGTAGTRGDASPTTSWTEEDSDETAAIIRRLREVQAQLRNAKHARELKHLYRNCCSFCGRQTIIGIGPDRHYSEAAHIKPVGDPHKGPDIKSNMLILCPEHHLQFDRGVLSLRKTASGITITSKIPGDRLNGAHLSIKAPHIIEEEFVKWHAAFWR